MPAEENLFAEIESAMGSCLHAMSGSQLYAKKPLAELYETLLPALTTKQYRLVRNAEGKSVAFISWAMVSDEVLSGLSADESLKLKISDWQSGETGLLMDVVANNPKASNLLVSKLKNDLFKDRPLKAIRLEKGKATLAEVTV